jgi:nitrite reductase (NADH) small subunit
MRCFAEGRPARCPSLFAWKFGSLKGMSDFVRIAGKSELPGVDSAQEYAFGDRTICIANVNGEYCALDNVCPHQGGPLGMGYVEGTKVVCPWHGWQIEAKTGVTETGEAAVPVYELRIEGDDVLVKV